MSGKLNIFRIALTLLFAIVVSTVSAQTIKGNVKDTNGEAVIGATVTEEGTKNATVTDFDGNFTLKLTGKKAIIVSFIGMKNQTVNVAGKQSVNVVLQEDAATLNEVVVVGYGTMKKSDLTGSVSSIDTEGLTQKGASSVMEALQGSVPGVNITKSTGRTNGSMDIEIRGKSSINSSTKPIYVIDGIICDDMSFLNEQDIERIDILKDASSTAIYGSRATAGVVMVTTKSGQGVGKKGSKPTISYDGYYGITKIARMPDFQSASDFYQYRFLKFLTYAEGTSASALSGQPNYVMDSYKQMALWNNEGGYGVMKQMLNNGESYDWPSMVTQNGRQQNHYIAMSGSGDKINYHMGLGYNDVTGTYKGDEQSRITFKGSVDAKLNKIVTAGFTANFAYIKNKYANDDMIKYAYRMNPFMKAYDAEGNVNEKPGNYLAMGSSNGYQFSDQTSPLLYEEYNILTKERDTYRLMGNIYFQIQPIKSLTIKTVFNPTYSYYRDGSHTEANETLSTTDESSYGTSRSFGYTWDNTVTFDETFNKKHHVNVMGLFSTLYNNTEKVSLTQQNVLAGSLWYNLNDPTNMTSSSTSYSENSMVSYALRANYTFDDKYMITGTVRWDGSSKFTKDNRWGAFPSAAVAWRASEESFIKEKAPWISNLKFRLSYGVTGNCAGIGNYDTKTVISTTQQYYPFGTTFNTAKYASAIVNENLTWEKSHEWNFGIDYGFLNNRINGSIELYTKKTTDLLFGVTLPLEAGLTSSGGTQTMNTNVGSVRNKGIEISLNTVNIQTKDWRWETTFTFAHNKNEILEINGQGTDLAADNLFLGQPINIVRGYDWLGIVSDRDMTVPDNQITRQKLGDAAVGTTMRECDYYYKVYGLHEGEVIIDDVNGDGTWDDNDKKIWSSDPKWTGSFTSNLSYKNWDFSFSIYTKQKYKVSSNFYGEYYNWGDRGRMKLNADYYIPAGTLIDCDGINEDGTYINPVYQQTTHYGDFPFPNNGGANGGVGNSNWSNSANKITDASFVKVKNISLGYTFPKNWINKIGMSQLRLYATVTNPFVFTSYKGFDPEWADAALKNDGPSTVTWEFGASLKF